MVRVVNPGDTATVGEEEAVVAGDVVKVAKVEDAGTTCNDFGQMGECLPGDAMTIRECPPLRASRH